MSRLADFWRWRRRATVLGVAALTAVALLPLFLNPLGGLMDFLIYAVAYSIFALGLNIVVGFAGLLDLGYVAFYAIGAYSVGWFASDHFAYVNHGKGIHIGVTGVTSTLAGIHLNFLLLLVAAMLLSALLGALIGLPTLRLRGDYIAIVTLAFGEIIGTIAVNGDSIKAGHYTLTEGPTAISPVDQPQLPGLSQLDSATSLRGYFWLGLAMAIVVLLINRSLRDSRLGRAWIAVREDEVAAASMGVPLVRTKLLAYAVGAALGGAAGAFLGSYTNSISSDQFTFSFSIFILAAVILGGLGSIWGVVLGAGVLAYIERSFIPDVLDKINIQNTLGLNFTFAELGFGVFGFLLVIMMILRPEGLFPERRRKIELTEGTTSDTTLYEVRS